jgi:hypothetical protein
MTWRDGDEPHLRAALDARHLKYPGCGTDPNQRPCYTWSNAGVKMTAETIEKLITNSIHTAFVKYPEGDGGPNLDYEWIPPEHSSHITKAILMDLEANGFQIVKKGLVANQPDTPRILGLTRARGQDC